MSWFGSLFTESYGLVWAALITASGALGVAVVSRRGSASAKEVRNMKAELRRLRTDNIELRAELLKLELRLELAYESARDNGG